MRVKTGSINLSLYQIISAEEWSWYYNWTAYRIRATGNSNNVRMSTYNTDNITDRIPLLITSMLHFITPAVRSMRSSD